MITYYGKIRLKSGGQAIGVRVEASSNSTAKKAIEAQYSGQIKHWDRQMSSNP
ncbi:MAG: hypothetical protein GQ540_02045 [Lutibacter sp.]|uniref:hypothetical protein n=1 Tax=Lutibacter sp. TaxID=1925666 RepID=UPI0019E43CDE|nr:hypothetical protein [Lutibacter sp.]NOR27289.1 hypothetical protein [Lutibacter sp.]